MNDFATCIAESHTASDSPIWDKFYNAFFPTMQGMHDHKQDGNHQRLGIDRTIVLENGKTIWVDEKVRKVNSITGKIYDDIALEEWSDEVHKKPGWVIKPLLSDYIAYAILPLGKCYLLPVIQLQQAWLINSSEWKTLYPEIRAVNDGYCTVSWGIPVQILYKAIGACLRVTV